MPPAPTNPLPGRHVCKLCGRRWSCASAMCSPERLPAGNRTLLCLSCDHAAAAEALAAAERRVAEVAGGSNEFARESAAAALTSARWRWERLEEAVRVECGGWS